MRDTTVMRVRALQPDVTDEYFDDDVEVVTEKRVLRYLRFTIKCWQPPRGLFSPYFFEEFRLREAARQITTAVVVKTQKVICEIGHSTMLYDGKSLHDGPVPRDLRQLPEAEAELTFPLERASDRRQIRAGEFFSACEPCNSSGSVECKKCKGAGSLPCKQCRGAGETSCSACGGAGEVMQSATEARRCAVCSGRGTVTCVWCNGPGNRSCDAAGCKQGNVQCPACKGFGKLRNVTLLLHDTYTEVGHHLYCKNRWVHPTSELATDLPLIRGQTFRISGAAVKIEMLRSTVPENLRRHAVRITRRLTQSPTPRSWDLGTRVELRAGYVYYVVVEHLKQQAELFVSGCSNTVTLFKSPEAPKSLVKKVARSVAGVLVGNPTANTAHIEAVRSEQAFLADSNLLGPALRRLGLQVCLCPDGYEVMLSHTTAAVAPVQISFDFDASGDIVLHCAIRLGEADQDQFHEALILCNRLPVGQIALQEQGDDNGGHFFLVNRQPYATASPSHVAFLLRFMEATALHIRECLLPGSSIYCDEDHQRSVDMARLVELAQVVRINLHVKVSCQANQLIFTLALDNGRKQTVLVSVNRADEGELVEVRSRCAIISDARTIRTLLKRNFRSGFGGFAMQLLKGQRVIDCVQRLAAPPQHGVNLAEFLYTVRQLAAKADRIESERSNEDVF